MGKAAKEAAGATTSTGTPPKARMEGSDVADKDTGIGAAAAALFNVSTEKMGEMF